MGIAAYQILKRIQLLKIFETASDKLVKPLYHHMNHHQNQKTPNLAPIPKTNPNQTSNVRPRTPAVYISSIKSIIIRHIKLYKDG